MHVLKYIAKINRIGFTDIIGWIRPFEYTRIQPGTGGMVGHEVLFPILPIINMLPTMEPFTSPDAAIYPNNGDVSSGVYGIQRYASPLEFGLPDSWNISRLLQAQVLIWDEQNAKIKAFKAAVEGRNLEDT